MSELGQNFEHMVRGRAWRHEVEEVEGLRGQVADVQRALAPSTGGSLSVIESS